MKKISLVSILLVIFVLSVPSFATVIFTMRDLGNYQVELSYDASQASVPVPIAGFMIRINASRAEITDVVSVNDDYWVYPGSIIITNGQVEDFGTPVVSGLGTSNVVIEMGALYDKEVEDPPAISAPLLVFTVTHECDITIDDDTVAGGVVLEGGVAQDNIYSTPFHIIPEPMTVVLLGLGGLMLRRKK